MSASPHDVRKPGPTAFAAAALFIGLAVSGCASTRDGAEGTPMIVGAECHGIPEGVCKLEAGTLYVRGLSLRASDGPAAGRHVGLLIDGLSVPLVIQDLSVEAVWAGVEIGATCAECPARIEDAIIEAKAHGILVGQRAPTRAGIVLERVTVKAGYAGVRVDTLDGGLVLDGVQIGARSSVAARGVWNDGLPASLHATNVSIADVGRGIIGQWSSIRLRDVEIDCVADAIWGSKYPNVDANRLRITNCYPNATECNDSCTVAAISLGGGWDEMGGSVVLRGLELTNYSYGISLGPYRSVHLEDFRIQGGNVGVHFGDTAEELVMRNGTISENARNGMVASADKLSIERVAFDHNGFGQDRFSSHAALDLRIEHPIVEGEHLAPLTIRNSSFTRNPLWALVAHNAFADGDLIDAAYNWWGSPAGPSPWPTEAFGIPRLPGLGDAARGHLMTYPHLTAPP